MDSLPVCAALVGVVFFVLQPLLTEYVWPQTVETYNAVPRKRFESKGTQARAKGLPRKFGHPADFFMNLYLRFRDGRQYCLGKSKSPDSERNVYVLAQESGFCYKHVFEFEDMAQEYASQVLMSWNWNSDNPYFPTLEKPHECARMIYIIGGDAHSKHPASFLKDLNAFADKYKGMFILYLATEYTPVYYSFNRMRDVNVMFNVPFDLGDFGIRSNVVSSNVSDTE